ncbi:MAG: AMP-binding protein, partial [Arenicella sp.]|nr:AMP-binding protein [Arenicella sp.]
MYKLDESEYVLFIGFHHIISDGWSNHIFLAELAFYYDAIQNGNHEAELPASALQYKDFAVWQRRCLEDGYKEHLLRYWRQQLDGWQVLNLIHDNQRSAKLTRTGSRYVMWLEPDLVGAVKAVSQQQSVTLFTQLLSVFYVLMSKLSGQTDICLGTDVANRTRQEVEGLIGFFVNQLVLRADLSDNPSYDDFVARIKQTTLDAYQHQDLPFDILVDELLEHHDLAHSPFFPVKFIMQNTPNSDDASGNWVIEDVDLPHSHAKFEMTWSLTEHDKGIEIVIEYDNELFNEDTIAAYAQFYRTIAERVVVTPEMPVSAISLCAQGEYQHYAAFNRFNDRVLSEPLTLSESVEAYAASLATTIAVHDETGSLSYAELNQRANKLANVLQQQYGVEPESNIGVCLPSGLGYITTMVALSKLGAVLVPIDIGLPVERAAQLVEEADFTMIVSESDSLEVLPTYELNFIGLCCLDEIGDDLAAASDENLGIVVSEDQLAYMIFTSGTTGKPKGVMVSYKGCRTLAAEQRTRFFVTEQDRILQFASIGFDASVWEVIMALFNGASLYCQSAGQLMPGASLVEYINQFGITHVTLPPSALSVMPTQELPSLKVLILASEACNDELLEPWKDKVALFNAYGPSEATVCATIADFDKNIGGFDNSIGSPIMGTDVYIMDGDGQLAPPGVPGELCIGGVSLGRGYWRDPKQTAE